MIRKYTIYYTKKNSPFLFGYGGKPKTLREVREWYVRVYQVSWSGDISNNLEKIFSMLNRPNNPLGEPLYQDLIRKKKVSHTSMSVGDMIKVGRVWYYCADEGWEKLELM